MKIYNTLSRSIEEFKPIKKGKVGLYTCGPTVYNYAHIGNLRTYVFEDILKRVLEYNNYKVKHIMNITDVGHLTSDADDGEDKMEKGAAREGKTAWEISDFYEKTFLNDLNELNCEPANKYPRATDHINEQINLINELQKKGFAYRIFDGIYFDTLKLGERYWQLSKKTDWLIEKTRIPVLLDKKNHTDFALWKFSNRLIGERQMEWISFGKRAGTLVTEEIAPTLTLDEKNSIGFPGWHIECSAMSAKYLGQPFDIHCGGIDHIPVHHTNEIAQSEAAEGKPLANYWMHGEFLLMGSDKMAKSGDNFVTLQTLKEHNVSPLAYRFLLLQAHYRKQLTFSWEALESAQAGLNNLYKEAFYLSVPPHFFRTSGTSKFYVDKFNELICDDLDMPNALALTYDLLSHHQISEHERLNTLLKFDEVFGLQIKENIEHLKSQIDLPKQDVPQNIIKLSQDRDVARAAKDWAKSDELRKEIEAFGYVVEDTTDGTKINKI
jgi:cysteinyl-tRNA synthetase